jgi:hypothetical protein
MASERAGLTKKMGGAILVMVTRRGGVQVSWIIDAKNRSGSVRIAEPVVNPAIQHSHCSATEIERNDSIEYNRSLF